MSTHLDYLALLERSRSIDARVLSLTLGPSRSAFLQRGWIRHDGYLSHVMVPFLDSEAEVEVEVDETAGVFRYRSPQQRSRLVTQPLAEIALYTLRVDTWLDDLSNVIGIEPRHRSRQRTQISDHLWHLGDARLAGTHTFAPVFVGRLWKRIPSAQATRVFGDPIWPRSGILLVHRPIDIVLPREHALRALYEFIRCEDAHDVFDGSAFDRVLRGFVTPVDEPEPDQFLRGTRLKLPHFDHSCELSPERAKIIKILWGSDGKPPPEISWAEVNTQANTGYQSFDDAFGDARVELIEKTRRARYRLRRHP